MNWVSFAIGALVVLVLILIFGSPAHAAQPSSVSSIALASPSPSFGDSVTFDVSTSATEDPFVNLDCYQAGVLVSVGWAAFFHGVQSYFGLYSPVWQSGAADCRADLGMLTKQGKWKVLASTSFHVSA